MLFATSIILAAAASVAQAQGSCSSVGVRSEWRELSPADQQNYISAITCLKSGTGAGASVLDQSTGSPSRYDDFAFMHAAGNNAQRRIHGTEQFLVWHRAFLANYEIALRGCGMSIPLPYWDWAVDSQAPEQSVLWSAIGGDGDSNNGQCVPDGPFNQFTATFAQQAPCLMRQFSFTGNAAGSFFSPESNFQLVSQNTDYGTFARAIENNPHGTVHVGIGGQAGHMSSLLMSANAEVVFLSHTSISALTELTRYKSLRYLNVSRNMLTDVSEYNHVRSLSPSRPIPKLKYLNASHNCLVTFSGASFPGLVDLVLDGNCIPELDDLEEMCSLELLSIEDQRIDELTLNLAGLESLCELRELRTFGNEISSLGRIVGPHTDSLDCRRANLSVIPVSLAMCGHSLHRLNLSDNRISDVTPLAGLDFLQELDLSGNLIANIGPVLSTLRRLTQLRVVDLRYNPITQYFYRTDGPAIPDTGKTVGETGKKESRTAQIVREICYRSAVISAIGKSIEVLDHIGVSLDDRQDAKQRIQTLKTFMRKHRQQQQQQQQQQQPAQDIQDLFKIEPAANEASLDEQTGQQEDYTMQITERSVSFSGWVVESHPLGDITEGSLFVEADPEPVKQKPQHKRSLLQPPLQ
eukprot:jgi/Hompol1/4664/HPOL_002480-RA